MPMALYRACRAAQSVWMPRITGLARSSRVHPQSRDRGATRNLTQAHGVDSRLSLVAAIEDQHAAWYRNGRRAAALLLGCWGYDYASEWSSFIALGSAATEQLFMQNLEGTVELELTRRPFSSVGELRGLLTPIADASRAQGASANHRRFSLLSKPDGTDSSWRARRHAAAKEVELPPVSLVRRVSVLPSIRLSPLLLGDASQLTRYVRKSRSGTEFLRHAPHPGLESD